MINLQKTKQIQSFIEDVLNEVTLQLKQLAEPSNSFARKEYFTRTAFNFLTVLFEHLERNIKNEEGYSFCFHNYFGRAQEKLEVITNFESDKQEVYKTIGLDMEEEDND